MNEFSYPMLYLWRREQADSGGPGRFRGGLGGSSAFVIHDSPAPAVALVVSGGGKALPQSSGLSGGYPANTQYDLAIRGSNVRELIAQGVLVTDLEQIEGEREPMPPHLESMLGRDDVYFLAWQGGGGYGDPVHREPDAVAFDVRAGKVTPSAAFDVYGVVLADDGTPDGEATRRRRRAIRLERAAEAEQQEVAG